MWTSKATYKNTQYTHNFRLETMWTSGANFKTFSTYEIDGQIQCGQPQPLKPLYTHCVQYKYLCGQLEPVVTK